jgi:hypothetical protein
MSVRERLEQQANSGPNTAATTDHFHAASRWGTLQATNKVENAKQVSYELTCDCGARGQRVSQQELMSGTTPICRLCHGTGTAGDAPGSRQRTAHVDAQPRQELRGSVGQRHDAAKRAQEIAQIAEQIAQEEK